MSTLMWTVVAVSFLITGVGTGLLLPALRRFASDLPNHRSSHATPVPRGAGLAVVAGIVGGVCVGGAALEGLREAILVLVLALVLTMIGLVDDVAGLGVAIKLSVTVLSAGVLIVVIDQPSSLIGVLVSVIAVVGVAGFVNAFNFMDGINGISGVSALVASVWFAYLSASGDLGAQTVLSLAVAAACIGFLPWNLPSARVFLGDSGSLGIGMVLAGLAATLWASDVALSLVIAPMVVYVVDTGSTLLRRIASGRRWSQAHRDHVYQRLVDGGFSHTRVTLVVAGFSVLMCAIAGPSGDAFWAFACVLSVCYLALPTVAFNRRSEVPG